MNDKQKAELAKISQDFLEKVEELEILRELSELSEQMHQQTDLTIGDLVNGMHFLKQTLENTDLH